MCFESGLVFDDTRPDDPFLFIIQMIGTYTENGPVSGLIAAVWQDKRIVRASSNADVGFSYVQGTLSDAQFEDLLCMIERSRLADEDSAEPGYPSRGDWYWLRLKKELIVRVDTLSAAHYPDLREFLISVEFSPVLSIEGDIEPLARWYR
jgi:hypothetical protein